MVTDSEIPGDDAIETLTSEMDRGPSADNIYVNALPLSASVRRMMEKRGGWEDHLKADDEWRAAYQEDVPL